MSTEAVRQEAKRRADKIRAVVELEQEKRHAAEE